MCAFFYIWYNMQSTDRSQEGEGVKRMGKWALACASVAVVAWVLAATVFAGVSGHLGNDWYSAGEYRNKEVPVAEFVKLSYGFGAERYLLVKNWSDLPPNSSGFRLGQTLESPGTEPWVT